MKNFVPNPTWEIIAKMVLGKSWEREFPLMPARWYSTTRQNIPILNSLLHTASLTPYYSSLSRAGLIHCSEYGA